MHGHDSPLQPLTDLASGVGAASVVVLFAVVLFLTGLLPIPVGYDRGKVKWVMWCGTGMHAHIVYWTSDYGFQTLHPQDRSTTGGDA